MDEPNFNEGNYTTNYINEVAPQESIDTEFNFSNVYKKLAAAEARNMGM